MSRQRVRAGSEQGFTLVEALFSAALIAISVLGLSSMAIASARLSRASSEKSAALEAIETIVRQIEETTFSQIKGTFADTGFDVIADGAATNMLTPQDGDLDGRPGHIEVSVPGPVNDATLLLQVDLTVAWDGVSGPQQVTRTIFLSEAGQSG